MSSALDDALGNLMGFAEEKQAEDNFLSKAEVSEGVLIKFTGDDKDLIIPEIITAIGESAFESNEALISVTLPKSLKTIGISAFMGCKNLKKVNMPYGLEKIDGDAFCKCSSLEEINLPDSVVTLEGGAFKHCISLKKVRLSKSIKELKYVTFHGCCKLLTIFIPKNVIRIATNAFSCSGLVDIYFENDSLPELFYYNHKIDRVETTKNGELEECYALYSFGFEEENAPYLDYDKEGEYFGVTISNYDHNEFEIRNDNFYGATLTKYFGEKAYVKIPFGVRSLNMEDELLPGWRERYIEGFRSNGKLESIIFPETVFVLDASFFCSKKLFSGCYMLREVVLPRNIRKIPSSCFYGCTNLKQIVIPSSVNEIEGLAFSYSGLENINLPDGITEISDSLFSNCKALKKITIPEKVKKIGDFAFSGCTALESIVIQEGVESLGKSAFGRCASLKTVVLPKSLIYLNTGDSFDKTFRECTALEYVYLPRGRKEAFRNAFPSDYEAPKIKFIEQ